MSRKPQWLCGLLAVVTAVVVSGQEIPYLSGRVVDEADLLSEAAEERVAGRLGTLEESTGAQVVVLTVRSLEGAPIEDFSHRVASTWQLGGRGQDNGLLLLVARQERRMRIEVGYDLEGTLPDALAARILDDVIAPRFRRGDFEGGIEAGVEAIAAVISGEPTALAESPRGDDRTPIVGLFMSLFFMMIVLSLLMSMARGHRRYAGRGSAGPVILPWGGGFGGGSGRSGGFGGFSGGGGSFGGGGASGGW